MSRTWTVRLALRAEQDFEDIVSWTRATFGAAQAAAYAQTMMRSLATLHDGPDVIGSRIRHDIGPAIRTLRIAGSGRKGRHLIVFRAGPDHRIDVLRLLHEAMDPRLHLASK